MLADVQATIYARVPVACKEWVKARADEYGLSSADIIEALIRDAMETDARFQRQPPRVIR